MNKMYSGWMPGLSKCSFKLDTFDIQDPREWDGMNVTSDANGIIFTILANRHGSSHVADRFRESVGTGRMIHTDQSEDGDARPDKLNFAFSGTLQFTVGGRDYMGYDIMIGQGHSGTDRNNWWIGGKNMVDDQKDFGIMQFFKEANPQIQVGGWVEFDSPIHITKTNVSTIYMKLLIP